VTSPKLSMDKSPYRRGSSSCNSPEREPFSELKFKLHNHYQTETRFVASEDENLFGAWLRLPQPEQT
jgi:hypothetical protein